MPQSTMKPYYPLTHPQKRIWYTEKIYPDTSLNQIMGSVTISGRIDFGLLERSIHDVVRSHEGLHLRITESDGQPVQWVMPYEIYPLPFVDFSTHDNPDASYNDWIDRLERTPVGSNRGRLFDFPMFSLSDQVNGFLIRMHHIVSDGWSSNLIIEQISETYRNRIEGHPIDLEANPSYLDYLSQEMKYLESGRFAKNKRFWNDKFADFPVRPAGYPLLNLKGSRRTYSWDEGLSSRIKALTALSDCSLNTFFVFLHLLYVFKTSGERDRVIGTPVLNRSGAKQKAMVGMFTSTMPFRYTLDEEASALEALISIDESLKECYYNQKYPYDLLLQDLELNKKGGEALINESVNYYNTKVITKWGNDSVKVVENYCGSQTYSFQMAIKDWSDSGALTLEMDYKIQDYSAAQIDERAQRVKYLAEQIVNCPDRKLGEFDLLLDEERNWRLERFNDTSSPYPNNKTISRLFEEQVDRTPDREALSLRNETLTYRELNERANQLAHYLLAGGIGLHSVVGLYTRHSIESVIGMLAILKAGGAYLPIDTAYPADRIAYMLQDSGCNLVLVNEKFCERIDYQGAIIDLHDKGIDTHKSDNPSDLNADAHDLAYIIYTSGSTGKPKGVMIEHRSLVNYIWWAKNVYVKEEIEVFPLYSSLAFDLTVTSIFTPLISGGLIIVYPDDEEEYVLHRIMNDNRVTVIKLTPSHLSLLKEREFPASSVTKFIIGGEDLRTSLAERITRNFGGKIELYNEYGPTETTVGCMIHRYDPDTDKEMSVPIGIPGANVQLYILDQYMTHVHGDILGELYVSGDGVARGYRNRIELTGERFIPNPFVPGTKMYRTGDLARWSADGLLQYAGRVDQQVKIRGYRIELGEIERCLLLHNAVREAIVIDRESKSQSQYLCAYFVLARGVSSIELREHLQRHVPEYMIPAHYVPLTEIPLNVSGKVNRGLLPEPDVFPTLEEKTFSKLTDKEETLTAILGELLLTDSIHSQDHFYRIGGDSITAIQLASRLKSAGYMIRVTDILSHPIIGNMAAYMVKENVANIVDLKPCKGEIAPTPIVNWFFSHHFHKPGHYTQSMLLNISGTLNLSLLGQALSELVEHHDSLRINVHSDTGQLFYNPDVKSRGVEIFDLAHLSSSDQEIAMSRLGYSVKSAFDIHKDCLLRGYVFDLGKQGRRLLLTAHHLVVDGVSWRIMLEDLAKLLGSEMPNRSSLPSRTSSYQEWAIELGRHSPELVEELPYWNEVIARGTLNPVDTETTLGAGGDIAETVVRLTEDETRYLLTQARSAYGTEPQELMISALALAFFETFKREEIVIELEGHGRDSLSGNLDLTRTVGWFTSLYPVRLTRISHELSSQIKSIKEQLRRTPRKGIGYGILLRVQHLLEDTGSNGRVRFNYLGHFDATFDNPYFSLAGEDSGADSWESNQNTSPLVVNAWVVDRCLKVIFAFDRQSYGQSSVDAVTFKFSEHLKRILEHCRQKEDTEFTPSDFETISISQLQLDGLYL